MDPSLRGAGTGSKEGGHETCAPQAKRGHQEKRRGTTGSPLGPQTLLWDNRGWSGGGDNHRRSGRIRATSRTVSRPVLVLVEQLKNERVLGLLRAALRATPSV